MIVSCLLEAKPTCNKLDEIYLVDFFENLIENNTICYLFQDWVFLFVNQVEFMAKNPILCMWHATG